ncbi:MAG: hypothetical protein ONB44_17230 [candidate division KSB1 bacterium]|nr:hypothetical protein [candidate division KSB1 bacterium]MDZ7303879.1 hypothetical protein [candidate division KSB1 bacterium]MDZ7313197.1 hypothetical protein [candidate division KSB1 bacterium]
MNCKTFCQQLDSFEGGHGMLELSTDMQAHLTSCNACRAHFQMHQSMLAVLDHDPAPALPSNFTEKILGRLEPVVVPSRTKLYLNWKRVAVYAGYALVIALALWFGYKNVDFDKLRNSSLAQQGLTAVGATEVVLSLGRLFSKILSFIPTAGNVLEKSLGKEVMPQSFKLIAILMFTCVVAKVSVLIESWLRQISRRSS